ncbi:dephospho-CoA kinase [Candidatus Beckwithbacteria bacterium CG_4_10_14_0_2_um_filter_47_25]|uniref:Dephospho-CoA kinase n=1 Tax=Candidatus Beckwithbacteria bacterium CG_4_10_14_0_2_um_filter_47_25 TaxID=1974493 RepID=A0A2M7W6M2_9BACT|nr:MAG: dephospho-CoA kinase [Candidatus Beckwithbacteria bacterium CG_4_10_14_0_2_um_filter_47_25]
MAGAGKSEACRYLAAKGFPVLRFGDETDRGLRLQGLSLKEENERKYRENLRQELGMAAYAIKIEPRINEALKNQQSIILDGLYSWEEYVYLQPKFPGLKLIVIYARPQVRYRRLAVRAVRQLTPRQARARDIAEIEVSHKAGPIAIADYLVDNNGSLDQLHYQLDHLLANKNNV